MTGEISCGWHTICGLVKNSRAIPTLELHGRDWKLAKVEHGVLTHQMLSSWQTPSPSSTHLYAQPTLISQYIRRTPGKPPVVLSLWNTSGFSASRSSTSKQHAGGNCCPCSKASEDSVRFCLPHAQNCLHLFAYFILDSVAAMLEIQLLYWLDTLNPQRWVWKIIVLLYESSSVLTF